jgi:hypothetical protein
MMLGRSKFSLKKLSNHWMWSQLCLVDSFKRAKKRAKEAKDTQMETSTMVFGKMI